MSKIRKGDQVILNTGKDAGKTGAVLSVLPTGHVVVEGLNVVKKHTRPNPMRGITGGIISKEMPVDGSNVAIFNAATQKADRVGFKVLEDGRKIRVFKSSGESIDA
ncbi:MULTISPECIES: 50S ribosomal protein L24 [Methylophilus]|jgi:large subunit ribosomal protein L24|uniref:Large ribosomal subunit protein uL24 n=1 Tax=Methylophilus medardicus TaxID=2588534 RepID=A0A5B8CQ77_9PROT|nr:MULTISPECIES: 50S ribosomal protein L24 [Methylophilus]MBF4986834.1 50S ribosomal protein L24 [Methylophilus sp. 14]MBF4989952.1 50S ribosomal protein L24 [Methylophilus sp. QUAN]QDC43369.1 50S ribosomal protein L24 [Methylophilus medardicus]QDC48376.1 50S ribosomal protein L24 [Methylophilus medardicus]QDC52081.1 50S ribosomal protein L24 [Methylophilus medardicus]